MKMDYGTLLEQNQLLSQAQIQSLEILTMDNVELHGYLQNEYLENPILENTGINDMPTSFEEFASCYEQNHRGDYDQNEIIYDDGKQKREFEAVNVNKVEEYIKGQLNRAKYSQGQWKIISYLIECLDDNGFFTFEEAELAKVLKKDKLFIEQLLEDLRQLEPYGIFAKNLSQCLLRQLDVMGVDNEELNQIILEHLQDVADGKISNITRAMNITTLQVRKYIAIIEKLNPKPLMGFHSSVTEYIVPDIIYHRKDGQWEVVLNDRWMGEYNLNDYYLKMMSTARDQELFDYFRGKVERAKFIMNCLEQRKRTILGIAETILKKQQGYFEGIKPLRPMTMAEIADQMQVHPSTISRGVNGKYVQFPKGTVLMKSLFTAGITSELEEGSIGTGEIKKQLKELIGKENRKKPFSDQKLVEIFQTKGIRISRRAIAKYREEIGIKGSFERKEF
jgi:RNA polymerase sigma-54 factor